MFVECLFALLLLLSVIAIASVCTLLRSWDSRQLHVLSLFPSQLVCKFVFSLSFSCWLFVCGSYCVRGLRCIVFSFACEFTYALDLRMTDVVFWSDPCLACKSVCMSHP